MARLLPLALSLVVAALVFVAPVSNTGSDPALQLVAAQALVEHGTNDLAVYRADPRLSYDLERDYRVVRAGAARRYYLVLPPFLDAPAVLLARLAGRDMLRPADEQALQNLLSALVCALVTLLLQALLARLVEPPAALALTAVAVLGSPLVSTLGTALWAAGPALAFVLAALLLVVRPATAPGRGRVALVALLLFLAYLCRPATGFAALGLVAAGLAALEARARRRTLVVLLLLAVLSLCAAAWLGWRRLGTLVPIYYSPLKAWPNTPLGLGLYGTLLSPGRGLFVFCPFLLPILLGALVGWRRLAREPLARLAAVWIATQALATSVKPLWWGGNSYGPRLLLETIPAWALLGALLWRAQVGPRARRGFALAFALTGALSAAIHSGQGLWNPALQSWNRGPSAGLDVALLFDWRHPQFLASAARVAQRDLDWQMARLQDLRPAQAAGADSRTLAFAGFHALAGSWRPAGPRSRIYFRPRGFDTARPYLLELRASTATRQRWRVRLGDWHGEASFEPPGPFAVRLALSGSLLADDGVREFELLAPDAVAQAGADALVTGPRFHALRLLPRAGAADEVRADQDAPFMSGFGDLEGTGRWTVSDEAQVLLPSDAPLGGRGRLALHARGNGPQRVALRLGSCALPELRFSGAESTHEVEFECGAGQSERLVLALPDAHPLPGDARRLGVYVFWIRARASRLPP